MDYYQQAPPGMMSSEVVMLSNQFPNPDQSYFNGQQGYNFTAPDGEQQVKPPAILVQEPNALKPAAQTSQDAVVPSRAAVEESKALVKSGSNNSLVSMSSNADVSSKHHQTAEELKKEEDDNKAEEDGGPMAPFFL